MILSCVLRIKNKLGYAVGAGLVIQTLRGSRGERISALGLDTLSTFGLMKSVSQEQLREYMDALEQAGYLVTEPVHRTLRVTAGAGEVLYGGQTVTLRVRQERAPSEGQKQRQTDAAPENAELFEALRTLRREVAAEEGVAAFMVFSDATLRDMAAKAPQDEQTFLEVSGVGAYKLKKYGKVFMKRIRELTQEA